MLLDALVTVLWLGGLLAGVWFMIAPKRDWPIVATRLRALAFTVGVFFIGSLAQTALAVMIVSRQPVTMQLLVLLALAAVSAGLIWLGNKLAQGQQKTVDQRAALAQRLVATRDKIAAPYAYKLVVPETACMLCMDANGTELRFTEFDLATGDASLNVVCKVADILSVDVDINQHIHLDATATTFGSSYSSTGYAAVGGRVGFESSSSHITGTETQVYDSSDLVFGLADLQRPAIRFRCFNKGDAEGWLYRIRAAMAKLKAAPAMAG